MKTIPNTYEMEVSKRYTVYNSLFLDLPFDDIYRTGTLLPILTTSCMRGFELKKTPKEIIEGFFEDIMSENSQKERYDLLFEVIKYVERQVVLFDSIEDAAYEKIIDIHGKGSMSHLVCRVEDDKKTDDLLQKLKDFSVRVTLTAHPTQFYPGNVLAIITDLEAAIRADDLGNINTLMHQLGKTGFINRQKPSPYDEAVSLCWFLEHVFYKSIPDILLRLMKSLDIPILEWENPGLFKVGFWPGGDRDGNPYVTHDITLRVASLLRESVLSCYYRDIRKVKRRLTFKHVEDLLISVENGVYQTLFKGEEVFKTKEDILKLLYEARDAILKYHNGLFIEHLDKLILKVKIFGLHFASLDIRQDSSKHDALWDSIIELNGGQEALETFKNKSLSEQAELIMATIHLPDNSKLESFHQEMIETARTIQKIQEMNGIEGCHRYVISNSQSPKHVLQVFQLCRLVWNGSGYLDLDIVPLFETIDDLAHAPAIMESLYSHAVYKLHLHNRGNKQTIMLGFSDGTKDGGYMRANWSILRAKEELTKISRKYQIDVVFFDGRGGPPARGGGNLHNFYRSLGSRVENKEIQVTIQGQTISSNYGKEVSCTYNLEQLLSAGLENYLYPGDDKDLSDKQREVMENLAIESYQAYKDLKAHPQFVPYLEKVAPLKFFGQTNIGSRPIKRGKGAMKFEDLRAIPFVGSWSQMKQNIPGFYGVGKAIESFADQGDLESVKDLYENSLFFRTLIGNSMQSLTKSFFEATAYLEKNETYGEFWKVMYTEYKRTISLILKISSMEELLSDNPISKMSIKIREKIVLPLITIQQYAIQSMLENDCEEMVEQKLILRTMFGIINAARNAV